MTNAEFKEWFAEHCSCFTGIPAWMAKLEKSVDGAPARDVMRQWYGVLCDVDLAAAKHASHMMHAGELEEPKGFDRHPAAIRHAAGLRTEHRKQPWEREQFDREGNRLYACLLCLDLGWVICWHPTSMKAAADGTLGKRFTIYSVAVPCTCEAGRARDRKQQLPRFSVNQWLPLDRIEDGREVIGSVSDKSEQQRLVKWMSEHRPANYEPAFAEFSETEAAT